jgi:mono/diheme cytochrome c family protein
MSVFFLLHFFVACGDEAASPNVPVEKIRAKEVNEEQESSKAVPQEVPKMEEKVEEVKVARTGQQLYTRICVSCHMPNGQGLAGINPPLAGSEWLTKDSSVPIRIVLHGLMGEIEVAGSKYNGVMSPWGSQMSDQEVANVLNYVRSSWGNKSDVELTAEMVKEQRDKYPGKALWNAKDL